MKSALRFLTIAVLASGFAAYASADTIFTLSATLTDASSVTGALDIDTTLGTVNGVDLFVADDVADTYTTISNESTAGTNPFFLQVSSTSNPTGDPEVELLFPGSLIGYTGGALFAGAYVDALGTQTNFSGGSLSSVGTPEPATGAIVGLALAGLVGFASRRKLARFRA